VRGVWRLMRSFAAGKGRLQGQGDGPVDRGIVALHPVSHAELQQGGAETSGRVGA